MITAFPPNHRNLQQSFDKLRPSDGNLCILFTATRNHVKKPPLLYIEAVQGHQNLLWSSFVWSRKSERRVEMWYASALLCSWVITTGSWLPLPAEPDACSGSSQIVLQGVSQSWRYRWNLISTPLLDGESGAKIFSKLCFLKWDLPKLSPSSRSARFVI